MCDRCGAVRAAEGGALSFKNTSQRADYAATCVSHADYLRTTRRVSPWSAIGGWQIENTMYDWSYLGTAASHVASSLKLVRALGYFYERDESEDLFLKRISLEMKRTCKQHGRLT